MNARWRFVVLGVVCACAGTTPERAKDEHVVLGAEIAARVGSQEIPVALVAKVASSERVAPREALRRLIDDAVAAEAARSRGLENGATASWLTTAARARFIADRWQAEARAGGPPTDAEIEKLTEQQWRQVDRPVSVRVIHALACPVKCGSRRPKPGDPQAEADARAVAAAIRDAVTGAKTTEDFDAKAKAVPHPEDVEVRVEELQPFDAKGRIVEEGGSSFVPEFATPAFGLARPGDTAIFESPFGWHVARLIERLPEQRMSLADRRLAFAEEVYTMRARDVLDARLAALRSDLPIELMPSAEELMRRVTNAAPSSSGAHP